MNDTRELVRSALGSLPIKTVAVLYFAVWLAVISIIGDGPAVDPIPPSQHDLDPSDGSDPNADDPAMDPLPSQLDSAHSDEFGDIG